MEQKISGIKIGSGTILVVEDDPDVRKTAVAIFNKLGYVTLEAKDGVSALEILEKDNKIDLLFTDVMMPRMDGYELTRELRSTDAYRDIPIVMVTSRGERIDRIRGFDAGVDEYITKPHDRHELLRAVRRLLPTTSTSEETE